MKAMSKSAKTSQGQQPSVPQSGQVPGSAALPLKPSPELPVDTALSILQYLNAREVLCTLCGYKLSTQVNSFHSHCPECAATTNQTYSSRTRKASRLDKVLAERLAEWAERIITGDK